MGEFQTVCFAHLLTFYLIESSKVDKNRELYMAKGIKTGGRKAGTPNRLTKELRQVLKDIIYDELQNLPDTLDGLEPKDRVELVIKLMSYTLPKVRPVMSDKGEPHDWQADWNTV